MVQTATRTPGFPLGGEAPTSAAALVGDEGEPPVSALFGASYKPEGCPLNSHGACGGRAATASPQGEAKARALTLAERGEHRTNRDAACCVLETTKHIAL